MRVRRAARRTRIAFAALVDTLPESMVGAPSYVGMVCCNVRCITRNTPTKEASWQQRHLRA